MFPGIPRRPGACEALSQALSKHGSTKSIAVILFLTLFLRVSLRYFKSDPLPLESLAPSSLLRPSPPRALGASLLRPHGDSFYVEVKGEQQQQQQQQQEQPQPPATTTPTSQQLPRILILTPVKNAVRHLGRYFDLLSNLTYPSHLLSLGMMDSDSDDAPSGSEEEALRSPPNLASLGVTQEDLTRVAPSATLTQLLLQAPHLVKQKGWARVVVARHDFGFSLPRETRHTQGAQLERRGVLARSRNHLLSMALEGEDWVVWLDSDLKWYPGDLLQSLVAAAAGGMGGGEGGVEGGREEEHPSSPTHKILVPNCVLSLNGGRSYDLNSWRGGVGGGGKPSPPNNATVQQVLAYHNSNSGARPLSKQQQQQQPLALEGYGPTGAFYLHQFKRRGAPTGGKPVLWVEGEEDRGVLTRVRLDGVGGAVLMVHAELHRHGLVFPPFPYRGRIETEGLSMMALDMGVLSYGLPFLEVLHT